MRLRPRLSQRPSLTSGPLKKISAYSSWSSNGSDSPKKNGTSVRAKWVATTLPIDGTLLSGRVALACALVAVDSLAYFQLLNAISMFHYVLYDLYPCTTYL
jgi:hypothetical protein